MVRVGFEMITLLACIIPLLARSEYHNDSGFVVRGHMRKDIHGFIIAEPKKTGRPCPFKMHVFGSAWHLTLTNNEGGVFEFGSDGTNSVAIFYDPDPRWSKFPVPVEMHGGNFPFDNYYVSYLWLAYGSSTYLDAGQRLPAPWLHLLHSPIAFMYETEIARYVEPPCLPYSIDFVSRRTGRIPQNPLLKVEGVSEAELRERASLPGNLFEGLRAEYRVLASTNFGGLRIPTSFVLRYYGTGLLIGTNTPGSFPLDRLTLRSAIHTNVVVSEMFGVAEIVQQLTTAPPFPKIPGRGATVIDRRFRSEKDGVDHITYNISNVWILNTNDPRLTSLFRQKTELNRAPKMVRKPITLLAFLLLSAAAAALWWHGRKWYQQIT